MKQAVFGFLGIGLVTIACGGAAIPQDQLASSQAAIRAAEVGGAEGAPQTALLVKKSKEKVAAAKKLIEDGKNHPAKLLLLTAEADADLALSLAQELSMRKAAEDAQRQVHELQKRQE